MVASRNGLIRVVKDDAERVALAGAHPADAVPQIDAIDAFRALHRAIVHGEEDAVAHLIE
jgi:hypothetical protein